MLNPHIVGYADKRVYHPCKDIPHFPLFSLCDDGILPCCHLKSNIIFKTFINTLADCRIMDYNVPRNSEGEQDIPACLI